MKILNIKTDATAIFKERPNKYIAIVDVVSPFREKDVNVHVHDPGRLSEILYEGNKLLLKFVDKPTRKTKWDVIAGDINNKWVLIHSNYHRKISEKILQSNILPFTKNFETVKPEAKFKNHRLDFLCYDKNGRKTWIEVKGCTLGRDNIALFPDAPTKRGTEHLKILLQLQNKGDDAKLIILIFAPDIKCFMPNKERDENFANEFYNLSNNGISIHPLLLTFENDAIFYKKEIPICDFCFTK